jgi:hypothetical protein
MNLTAEKMSEKEITTSTTITTSLDELKKYVNELTASTSGLLTTSDYTIYDGVPYTYYYNPFITTTTSLPQNEVENSNELKINIKKSQIKFNFNL